ncbi:MAG: hypothetical protein JSV90_05845 [Methanobacteriota archaeon]|nr:MAG: hypothetical protein JSV90_05845 [Euryarchaeota archaeon]
MAEDDIDNTHHEEMCEAVLVRRYHALAGRHKSEGRMGLWKPMKKAPAKAGSLAAVIVVIAVVTALAVRSRQ